MDYSLVITSCGRFDLLRRTVASFLKFADVQPKQYILVKDSGDESVREVLAPFNLPFEILVNKPSLAGRGTSIERLHAAIDRAYTQVKFPYIFHCEDDWEFFRTGFIQESFIVLNALPKASAVILRGRDWRKLLRNLPVKEIKTGNITARQHDKTIPLIVRFCHPESPDSYKMLIGYYMPGLRRLADYKKVAPLSKIKGGEAVLSYRLLMMGFTAAHLEIPACAHIGYSQRTMTLTPMNNNRISSAFWKYRLKLHIFKRRIWYRFSINKEFFMRMVTRQITLFIFVFLSKV